MLPGPGMLGAGTVIAGLTPPLSISVAPRGIELPARPDPEPDEDGAVPPEDVVDVGAVQPGIADPAASPPPSKVEFAVDVEPAPLLPATPVDDPADEQVALGAGLRPPGSISVAPSGIPVPLDPFEVLEPGMPSGDVAPMAGGLDVVCASAGPVQARLARTESITNRM